MPTRFRMATNLHLSSLIFNLYYFTRYATQPGTEPELTAHIGIQLPPEGDFLDFSQLIHLKQVVYTSSSTDVNSSAIVDRFFDAGPSLEEVVVFRWAEGLVVKESYRDEDPQMAQVLSEADLRWAGYSWD